MRRSPDAASASARDSAPPLDHWLAELGLEVVDRRDDAAGLAVTRDIILDGERRFDLRVTLAWVADVGLSVWAYYGQEAMEIPKRVLLRMLHAHFEYPLVKFALTDDDRPMLMTELPPGAVSLDEVGRALTRIAIVADRLLEETSLAIRDRGDLPDWTARRSRNEELVTRFRAEVEAAMPAWEPPGPGRRSRERGTPAPGAETAS